MAKTRRDPTLDAIVQAALESGATLTYRDGELTVQGTDKPHTNGRASRPATKPVDRETDDTRQDQEERRARANERHKHTADIYGRNNIVKAGAARIIYCAVNRTKYTRLSPGNDAVDAFYTEQIHHDLMDQIATWRTVNRLDGISTSAVVAAMYTVAVSTPGKEIPQLSNMVVKRVARDVEHQPRYPGSVYDLYLALVGAMSKES